MGTDFSKKKNKALIYLDEIQKVNDWKKFAHRLAYSKHQASSQTVISGRSVKKFTIQDSSRTIDFIPVRKWLLRMV